MDLQAVNSALSEQKIELPSWAFGNSGTRFKVFAQPGVPRDPYEKVATPLRCTSTQASRQPSPCTSVDATDNYARLATAASEAGISSAPSTPTSSRTTTTSGQRHQPRPAVRRKALDHLLECVDVMDQTARAISSSGLRRHQLPGSGQHLGPPGPAGRALAAVYAGCPVTSG